ncbi:hypothetical protein [Deinococcus arcticus]|uniref:GTPase n=1 Tax=Deinococcus arcticus TaxID=2136176 RepID=A0A2T3WCW6_9DEIO|nr:hypothetical protein [Deinococcus arcticus]PTA69707.1 hypothetical protein C8263_01435 [Deinococcus arcticus]
MSRPHLVFVYNADGGVLSGLKDLWHKTVSPHTYDCQLCAVTYGPLGMRREWRTFVQGLGAEVTFLHRDELRARHGLTGVPLPAAFVEQGGGLRPWLGAEDLRAAHTLDDLMALVQARWAAVHSLA